MADPISDGERCPVCERPYLLKSRYFDLTKCCVRTCDGGRYAEACLLEGLRIRDARLEGYRRGGCAWTAREVLPCLLPEGHDGRCVTSEAEKRYLETGGVPNG